VSRNKYIIVYTREGKLKLTWSEWWKFDGSKLHREDDLPAVEYPSGIKHWYKNGKKHRETGPAVVWPDGDRSYFLEGEFFYTEKNFYKKLREADKLPLSLALTHEEEWVRERAKRRLESE
jgi:hypothetical protein